MFIRALALAALLIAVPLEALAVELKEVSLQWNKYRSETSIFPEVPGEKINDGLALNVNLQLLGPVFWENQVHTLSSGAQYLWVGWHFRLGVQVFDSLSIGYEHHSQHILDHAYPGHFPVNDSLFVLWYLYKK